MKVIVIGGGKFGAYLANLLLDSGCTVRLIEHRASTASSLQQELPPGTIVLGSGTDPAVLETAGIAGTDVVAAMTGADEVNLVAATIAKFEYGIPRVIARVNNPKNAWLFDGNMGVDVGLNQADLMAHLVLEEIDLKNVMTLLKLGRGAFSVVQVTVDEHSHAANQAVKDLDIPKSAVLFSVSRKDTVLIPRGDTILHSGDHLLLFSSAAAEAEINALFGSPK